MDLEQLKKQELFRTVTIDSENKVNVVLGYELSEDKVRDHYYDNKCIISISDRDDDLFDVFMFLDDKYKHNQFGFPRYDDMTNPILYTNFLGYTFSQVLELFHEIEFEINKWTYKKKII